MSSSYVATVEVKKETYVTYTYSNYATKELQYMKYYSAYYTRTPQNYKPYYTKLLTVLH